MEDDMQLRRQFHAGGAWVDEIHVWRARLNMADGERKSLAVFLSADERSRANRFRFARDKNRFIAGRGFLRLILGRYTGLGPEAIRFTYNAFGKPGLADSAGPDNLAFNLSHAGDVALIALASGRRVGVDIERIRDEVKAELIAGTFFSDAEQRILEPMPKSLLREAFYKFWARKEALVKAMGLGFSFPLDRVDVSREGEGAWSGISIKGNDGKIEMWYVRDLTVGEDHAAALAVEGETGPIVFREIDLAMF